MRAFPRPFTACAAAFTTAFLGPFTAPFHCLSAAFRRLSLTFHCPFPLPFTAFPLPFCCAFHCFSTASIAAFATAFPCGPSTAPFLDLSRPLHKQFGLSPPTESDSPRGVLSLASCGTKEMMQPLSLSTYVHLFGAAKKLCLCPGMMMHSCSTEEMMQPLSLSTCTPSL